MFLKPHFTKKSHPETGGLLLSFVFRAGRLRNPSTVSYWIIEGLQTNSFFPRLANPLQTLITYAYVLVSVLGWGGGVHRPPRITCYVQKLPSYCQGKNCTEAREIWTVCSTNIKANYVCKGLLVLDGTCHYKMVWGEKGSLHINSSLHQPPFQIPDLSGRPGFPCRMEPPPPSQAISPQCCRVQTTTSDGQLCARQSEVRRPAFPNIGRKTGYCANCCSSEYPDTYNVSPACRFM
jgi:hypothetical protein